MTAKKKVAAAPVDQEETFVSLAMAKNLGETESSVEEKLRALYKIQQTDTAIDKIYLLRGELPLEVKDIEDEIEGLNTRSRSRISKMKSRDSTPASPTPRQTSPQPAKRLRRASTGLPMRKMHWQNTTSSATT